jgi:hypothetical protein
MDNIKFNHDLTESLEKLNEFSEIEEGWELIWNEFLKHIDEQPMSILNLSSTNEVNSVVNELSKSLASDKFYDEREYQHALTFIDLFIEKWQKFASWILLKNDLADLVDQLSRGKITQSQVIDTLESIVKHGKNAINK